MGILSNILQTTPPRLIYHYTSQTGLLGIVRNKCMWATSAHYQNDSTEFLHALDLSKDVVNSLRSASPPAAEERLLRAMNQVLNSIKTVNVFVCSFSEHKDMLSQWRGYCPRGNGFSIGMDFHQLQAAVTPQGFRIVPCVYDGIVQRQLVTELIDDVMKLFRIDLAGGVHIKQALRNRSTEYMHRMFSLAPIIKHATFSEEREWRAVSMPMAYNHPQVAYREGTSMLTPYFVLKLDTGGVTLPIREVVVGPTPHVNLSINAVSGFLIANTVPASVSPSGIPFRGW